MTLNTYKRLPSRFFERLSHRLRDARDRCPSGQEPPKNATLCFCGLVFALEIIQSPTTLQKLVVLFAHQNLFTGEEVPGQ